MKLHHAPQTRSGRPRWLLEELGVPYEIVPVNITDPAFPGPDYLKLHPLGRVPVLEDDDGTVIFESAAICAHLADKHLDKGLAPPPGTPERARYFQWLFFATTELEVPCIDIFESTLNALAPDAADAQKAGERARKDWNAAAAVLEAAIKGNEGLLGARFSAADVVIGSILVWGKFMGLLEGFPELQAYVKRLGARPANKRSRG